MGLHCFEDFSLVVASRGHSLVAVQGLFIVVASRCWGQALQCVGFIGCGARASEVMVCGLRSCRFWALEHRLNSCGHRLSWSVARGILPTQGSNPCLLHGQVDSLPLSPWIIFLSSDEPCIKVKCKNKYNGAIKCKYQYSIPFLKKSGRVWQAHRSQRAHHVQHTATPGVSMNNGASTFDLQWNTLFTTCSGWNKELLVKSSFLHSFSSTHAHHLRMWSFTLHCILKGSSHSTPWVRLQ